MSREVKFSKDLDYHLPQEPHGEYPPKNSEFLISESDLISDDSSFFDISECLDNSKVSASTKNGSEILGLNQNETPILPVSDFQDAQHHVQDIKKTTSSHCSYDDFDVPSDALFSDFFTFSLNSEFPKTEQCINQKSELPSSTPSTKDSKQTSNLVQSDLLSSPSSSNAFVYNQKPNEIGSESIIKQSQLLLKSQNESNLESLNKTEITSSIPWTDSPQYHIKYTAHDLENISNKKRLENDLNFDTINTPNHLDHQESNKEAIQSTTTTHKKNLVKTSVWQSRLTGFVSPLEESPIQQSGRSFSTTARIASQNPEKQSSLLKLSEEQRRVLHFIVNEERNVFFTGAAGTGKSILLRRIINELRRKNKFDGAIAVTASTGLAACNIGGITLHSFCGIGLGREPVKNLLKKIRMNRNALKRWKNVKILIIDEISMIDGVLFDKLEELARLIKRNNRPFGGIQVILTGDFFQLPPVFKIEKDYFQKQMNDENEMKGCLAFHSQTWNTVINTTVELKKVFRQQDDHFSQMLNSIREGQVTNEISSKFRALSRPLLAPHDITPTELYPLRRDVDRSNEAMMKKLPGKTKTYTAVDTYNNEYAREYQILNNLICPEVLSLKVGAQVMLIKNIDETLVNGSLGKLLGFMNEFTFKLVEELPENLANSVITGKISAEEGLETYLNEMKQSSDQTLDQNNILQRLSQLIEDDPYNIPVNYEEIDRDTNYTINWTRKKELIDKLNDNTKNKGKEWPFVRFIMSDGTTRDILVQAETWDIENIDGKVEASRSQVPLMLAWALSIHKSQGQTLNWVKVDLSKIFECGQAYVALSRAVKMEGLQVIGFQDSKIRVHPDVIEFYKALPSPLEIPLLETTHKKKNIGPKRRKLEA